jgi:hypothetical protein
LWNIYSWYEVEQLGISCVCMRQGDDVEFQATSILLLCGLL